MTNDELASGIGVVLRVQGTILRHLARVYDPTLRIDGGKRAGIAEEHRTAVVIGGWK